MKRKLALVLALCLIVGAMAGCGNSAAPTSYDIPALSAELEKSAAFSDILSPVDMNIASALFGFDPADVSEGSLLCSTGATTEEIGIFKCVDEEAAKRVKEFAAARVISQRKAYESYAPEEMPKLDAAVVKTAGAYVFYVVSTDSSAVEEIIGK